MNKNLKELQSFLLEKGISETELAPFLSGLKDELKNKKYGIVWEEQDEERYETLKLNFPFIKSLKNGVNDIEKLPDGPANLLIEGDNLHSLKVLEYTHKEQIDVIYIDPPYNTGTKDFIYNDSFVNQDDDWRHSKWLSFINKRLRLARELLKEEGVIFISIDDNELAQLKLLCDGIFREENLLAILPRVTKKSGKKYNYIGKNHDYVLVYAKNKEKCPYFEIEHIDPGFKYTDEYVDTRGPYKQNQTLDYDSLQYSAGMDYVIELDGKTYIPGKSAKKREERLAGNHNTKDWIWRWSPKLFKFGLANGFIVATKTGRIYTKTYANATISKDEKGEYFVEYVKRTRTPLSLDLTDNLYSNDNAKKEFKRILPNGDFEYPKPTSLLKYLLNFYPKKDITVLDFFAGTGTTGDAVIQLNALDGGNRRFILCTNNEISDKKEADLKKQGFDEHSEEWQSEGIARKVTYPRLKNVIEGYIPAVEEGEKSIPVTGTPANLKVFEVYLEPDSQFENHTINYLMDRCRAIISIKEDTFHLVEENQYYDILENQEKVILIYKNPLALDFELEEVSEKLNGYTKQKIIYSTKTDLNLKDIEIKGYPREILRQLKKKISLGV